MITAALLLALFCRLGHPVCYMAKCCSVLMLSEILISAIRHVARPIGLVNGRFASITSARVSK